MTWFVRSKDWTWQIVSQVTASHVPFPMFVPSGYYGNPKHQQIVHISHIRCKEVSRGKDNENKICRSSKNATIWKVCLCKGMCWRHALGWCRTAVHWHGDWHTRDGTGIQQIRNISSFSTSQLLLSMIENCFDLIWNSGLSHSVAYVTTPYCKLGRQYVTICPSWPDGMHRRHPPVQRTVFLS